MEVVDRCREKCGVLARTVEDPLATDAEQPPDRVPVSIDAELGLCLDDGAAALAEPWTIDGGPHGY